MTKKDARKLYEKRVEENRSNYLRNKARGFTDHQTKQETIKIQRAKSEKKQLAKLEKKQAKKQKRIQQTREVLEKIQKESL